MNISQFMSDNKPADKTAMEIDSLVKPFLGDIDKLHSSGYDLVQTVDFLKANGVHLTKSEIVFSCDRIKKEATAIAA